MEVLDPSQLCLARMTRHVRRVHRVPRYGADPGSWLSAALALLDAERFEVLFPTHEQVALLARVAGQVRSRGVGLAVPCFSALERLQDKVSAAATLAEFGIPQPPTSIARSADELCAAKLPAFVKLPISTASGGVYQVTNDDELRRLAGRLGAEGAFRDGLVVQQQVPGPLVMVQAIYDRGQLAAYHCCRRRREGARGGASSKESAALPELREPLSRLGAGLDWHAALSFDVILGPDGPVFIDVNPRLVEPMNAYLSGQDLTGQILRLSLGQPHGTAAPPRPSLRTHQILVALLGSAQEGRGRSGVLAELWAGMFHRGCYRGSVEELTPLRRDPLAVAPVAYATARLLARPGSWVTLAGSAVTGYALTPSAWREIRRLPLDE